MPELKEIALELVLDRHLGQVRAPEELSKRVQTGTRPERSRPVSRRLGWAMAAAMMAGGAAWTLHSRPDAGIRSSSAVQIRGWIQARTGLDVPLREAASVKLVGAHLTSHVTNGGPAAEIDFHGGTLTVTNSSGNVDNHVSVVDESRSGAKAISWTLRGQSYSLACDDQDQARAACLLCHS